MALSVESEVDEYGDEVPRVLFLGARRIAVVEALDRWFGRDHCYFKVPAAEKSLSF